MAAMAQEGATLTPYATLGLTPDATYDEVRAAYRKLTAIHHPDRPGGSAVKMLELGLAYEAILLAEPGTLAAPHQTDASLAAIARDQVRLAQQWAIVRARIKLWDPADHRIPKMIAPLEAESARIKAAIAALK